MQDMSYIQMLGDIRITSNTSIKSTECIKLKRIKVEFRINCYIHIVRLLCLNIACTMYIHPMYVHVRTYIHVRTHTVHTCTYVFLPPSSLADLMENTCTPSPEWLGKRSSSGWSSGSAGPRHQSLDLHRWSDMNSMQWHVCTQWCVMHTMHVWYTQIYMYVHTLNQSCMYMYAKSHKAYVYTYIHVHICVTQRITLILQDTSFVCHLCTTSSSLHAYVRTCIYHDPRNTYIPLQWWRWERPTGWCRPPGISWGCPEHTPCLSHWTRTEGGEGRREE